MNGLLVRLTGKSILICFVLHLSGKGRFYNCILKKIEDEMGILHNFEAWYSSYTNFLLTFIFLVFPFFFSKITTVTA